MRNFGSLRAGVLVRSLARSVAAEDPGEESGGFDAAVYSAKTPESAKSTIAAVAFINRFCKWVLFFNCLYAGFQVPRDGAGQTWGLQDRTEVHPVMISAKHRRPVNRRTLVHPGVRAWASPVSLKIGKLLPRQRAGRALRNSAR